MKKGSVSLVNIIIVLMMKEGSTFVINTMNNASDKENVNICGQRSA